MNIVFDIGGTNMRVAVAHDGELGEIKKVPTPQDSKQGIATLVSIAKEIGGMSPIENMAGCVAGRIDATGAIYDAKNLREWEGVNLAQKLVEALATTAHVANDAAVAGLGELKRGAGAGFSDLVYMTVSTGVGGAHVVENDILRSPILGELQLSVGDLETLVSGTAITKKFGIHPKDLGSLDERNKLADILAEGLAEIYETWKPDVFVIGGSMIVGVNPIPLERVREKFTAVPVKMAELGDNGGLIGGAILAMQK